MKLTNLEGKVAIVTGGASGIGRSVVIHLAKLGVKTVIADTDEVLGSNLATELSNDSYQVVFYPTDISNQDQIQNMVSNTLSKFKTIDILVNCAGVSGLSNYLDLIEEEWDWTFNINLKGTHLMCMSIAKFMVEKGVKGRIVNISSINDQIPVAGISAYSISKAAISGLTRAIALELAPYGINVNTIRPAAINTPMMKEILELPDLAHSIIRQIPRGRYGTPDDVAKVVIFLVSDLGEWVTGAEIPVTGGMHLVGEASYNYYFEKEMRHEDQLPDIPFCRPWKEYDLQKFFESKEK
jgi:NAD(P)-dependent dehydrogenase (short-subunit alcohol dehydrogenase family)